MDLSTRYNKRIYEQVYTEAHLKQKSAIPYDQHMLQLRQQLLRHFCKGRTVADLGCGTGEFLLRIAPCTRMIYGVDFSRKLLSLLKAKIPKMLRKKSILYEGDIQHLPLPTGSIDVAYSFATFYYIPDNRKAILETARILKPNGIAIIEFGNLWSINTIITRKSPTRVRSHHIPVSRMHQYLKEAGLEILEHKAFQLFPMYGISAWWMLPLLPFCLPQLKYLMGIRMKSRMLDEIISSLPLLNRLAFRHLFICRKLEQKT